MTEYGLNEKVYFSCNMRFGVLKKRILAKKAGFRMLLFGLESKPKNTRQGKQKVSP